VIGVRPDGQGGGAFSVGARVIIASILSMWYNSPASRLMLFPIRLYHPLEEFLGQAKEESTSLAASPCTDFATLRNRKITL
jgi:hypothetical protein